MSAEATVASLAAAIASDSDIAARLVSVIWIGSHSHGLDLHSGSDLDIQVILDEPDVLATMALAHVLAGFSGLDLSILYLKDIWDDSGDLDFQDGTKGPFFVPVLASGRVLHGSDVYASLRGNLPPDAVRSSLRFTIREYLGRLRVMALDQGNPGDAQFNKYVMKLAKDLLVHAGLLDLAEMAQTPNRDLVALANQILPPQASAVLQRASDYTDRIDIADRALVVVELDRIFDTIDGQATGTLSETWP
ncbi:hypothetical protein [Rhodococcoides fascians]|uniref:hypothetical protein n=1 Tax=Rhodococcoides fascians TaxID=1828 RepID=UPI00050C6653|nr:hypothetical protein [Rhodococcus fascians]